MDKPNLPAFYCTNISWECQASSAELLLQATLNQAAEWERKARHIVRSLSYESDRGQRLQCFGILDFPNTDTGGSSLHFSLSISEYQPWSELAPSPPTLEELVDAVIEEGEITGVNVTAMFSYPSEEFQSVIALPTPLASPDLAGAETIGIMIRVKDDKVTDKARYTNAISIGSNNRVFHSVQYRVVPPIGRNCITETLELASSFSRGWVVAKKEASLGNP